MSAPPNPGSGVPLWSGLSPEDVRALIRDDVEILRSLHARKAADDLLPPQKRDIKIGREISFYETAQDAHFDWLTQVEARESWSPRGETV